jgi:peptidoglycan/LPS O-acetylase OafA/YrhL
LPASLFQLVPHKARAKSFHLDWPPRLLLVVGGQKTSKHSLLGVMAPRIVHIIAVDPHPSGDTAPCRTRRWVWPGFKQQHSPGSPRSEKHIESLDGLRGIAVLLVFFFHYLPRNSHNPLSWLASLGWSGVDLFFVLSGFLITGILYDTCGSSNFFKAFYARRALRLFPLYFVAVGLVLFVAALGRTPTNWKAIPFYIYGANIMLGLGFAPDFTPYFQCTHFWSLALEEQFYSLWPLAIFFLSRRKTLIQICIAGVVCALLLRIVLTQHGAATWVLYTELPTRMDALFAGALLALGLRGPRPDFWLSQARLYAVMAGCCLTLVLLFAKAGSLYFASSEMTTLGYSMLAGVYVCIVALALVPGTPPNRIGRIRELRFFGRYSYGLYVWHDLPSPICVTWQAWFTHNIHPLILAQIAYAMAMLALFTGVAAASYHLLEVRFLELKSNFRYARPIRRSADQQRLQIHTAATQGTPEVKKQVLPPL